MNFIRYLGVSAFAVLMAFMVMSATPGTAHAANCGYGIDPGKTARVDQGCRVSGDVVVDGYRQYDDLSYTGLVVDIQENGGSSVYAPSGASVSIRTSSDLRDDLLRSGCNNGCSSVYIQTWYGTQSGYGQYSPSAPAPAPVVIPTPAQSTWFGIGANVYGGQIYYPNGVLYCNGCNLIGAFFAGSVTNGYVVYPTVVPPPISYPQAPTTSAGTQYFGQYARVAGGIIFLNGSHYCDYCTVDVYGINSSGYVIGGTVYPNFNAPPVSSPPPPYPGTIDGQPRAVFDNWSRFAKGDAVTGQTIVFDDGRTCTNWCYSTNASTAGTVYGPSGGQVIIHPYPSDVYGRSLIN